MLGKHCYYESICEYNFDCFFYTCDVYLITN